VNKSISISLKKIFEAKNLIFQNLLKDNFKIGKIISRSYKGLEKGGKLIFCGNGGSASDSQHLATEFLVRLRPNKNRISIPAISLTLDSTYMTACGNDYGFENVFSRALSSLGNKKDILFVISTSGNSKNIINCLKKAKKMGIYSFGFLGKKGGLAKKYCDASIIIKSENVARIQEAHIFLGHFILEKLEDALMKKKII